MQNALAEMYTEDYHRWLTANAEAIRWGQLSDIDTEHIAEELDAMSKRERREVISRLTVLLAHLLKWEFQPAQRSRSWRNRLTVQRGELSDLLEDSPSLAVELESYIDRAYGRARLLAEDETGLDASAFPAECPYALEAILDPAFLP